MMTSFRAREECDPEKAETDLETLSSTLSPHVVSQCLADVLK